MVTLVAPAGHAATAIQQWVLPPQWRCIEFISDLHLQQGSPNTFAALERHLLHTHADAVLILGDLFEAWVGDDAGLEGFEAECVAMLRRASQVRTMGFMAGNRDFLVGDTTLAACGLRPLTDPTVLSAFGSRLLITHGDSLCLDDTAYQTFRHQVRSEAWQREFLAKPLAERQALARHMRAESRRRQQSMAAEGHGDIDKDEALGWARLAQATILIHGHTHRPSHDQLAPTLERFVLSDWEFDTPTDASRGDVLRWTAAGIERSAPAAAPASPTA